MINIMSRFLSVGMRQCKYAIIDTRPLCCHLRGDPERAGCGTRRLVVLLRVHEKHGKTSNANRVIKAVEKCNRRYFK